jgi:dTDP-4-amino-4,6-dideoxygalactose transaminase
VQAALGRVQLGRLTGCVARRRRHAAALRRLPALRLTLPPARIGHAYYKYCAFVRPERLAPGWSRDRIMSAVAAAGVPCFSGSCAEMYLEKAFDAPGLRPAGRLPVARSARPA